MTPNGTPRQGGGIHVYRVIVIGAALIAVLGGGFYYSRASGGERAHPSTIPATPGASASSGASIRGTSAAAPLTRGAVIAIVRREVRREFALRDWHHYANYIDEYKGADAASLFSLSGLDRATAIGDMNAPVRVIAYEDYECPYCKAFEAATTPALHHRFRSRTLFVYRFYPLEMHGKAAQTEAIAGACVARIAGPDAFRRFTVAVFEKTGSNGRGTKEPIAKFAMTALRAGQSASTGNDLAGYYAKCTQGKLGAALVASDKAFKGVTGTPTIFVVNVAQRRAWRLAGTLPTWVFETLVANVLAGQPGNSDWAIERDGANLPDLD